MIAALFSKIGRTATLIGIGIAVFAGSVLAAFGMGRREGHLSARRDAYRNTLNHVKERRDVEERVRRMSPDERRRRLRKWARDR
ncbi:hypothetical protein HW532_19045 [Kaustia mangrovi]|uniref:Uncharacterized protein n=1 Tax=Kaustia mangrovi TaxID=2593653 RepID=A0A7S8C6X0_9HYPH|nr:hypothetical protein [Kaustia mangrovi]QPC44501.1 hypothetical protein HW532_18450 [Kaustia mangrovi]QPC44613.1 hypothetical protein HW532_19045 [Kaustia mangrovi]